MVPQVAVLRDLCLRLTKRHRSASTPTCGTKTQSPIYFSKMDAPIYRRRMRRFDIEAHARFLTFSCYKRLPLFQNDAIKRLFVDRLSQSMATHQLHLLGWVLMPEHFHLIVFPSGKSDIGRFTHNLKRPFAEAVLKRWKELNAPILKHIAHGTGHRFWQTGGGYDRNLTSSDELRNKLEYMHNNPVKRSLVSTAIDYPWSSARWYAGLPDALLPCAPIPQ
jgi:putative transposase